MDQFRPQLTPDTYLSLRHRLLEIPDARRAIERAAARIRQQDTTLSLEELAWKNFGDKPLFAQMRAAEGGLGARYAHMWDTGEFPSRAEMAGPGWEIVRRAKGDRPADENAYIPVGEKALAFYRRGGQLTMDGRSVTRPKVAALRLYRIKVIAERLPKALPAIQTARDLFQLASTPRDFLSAATLVARALDIGLTTAFHGLTDMGFRAIKPDIHVTRALGRLGAIADVRAAEASRDFLTPDLNKAVVVQKAVTFSDTLNKTDLLAEFQGNLVREVDIVLMQASLHGLV